jgi:hypothetical protein
MNNKKYNEVLSQIQEQLLETVNHLSKLKLDEIFTEEDDIDIKLQKSNRIIRYYAKYLQISEKIDQRTDNILSHTPHQIPKKQVKENKPESKKNKKSLQISAKTADYQDIKIDQPTTYQQDKLFKSILNKKNQYGLPCME